MLVPKLRAHRPRSVWQPHLAHAIADYTVADHAFADAAEPNTEPNTVAHEAAHIASNSEWHRSGWSDFRAHTRARSGTSRSLVARPYRRDIGGTSVPLLWWGLGTEAYVLPELLGNRAAPSGHGVVAPGRTVVLYEYNCIPTRIERITFNYVQIRNVQSYMT